MVRHRSASAGTRFPWRRHSRGVSLRASRRRKKGGGRDGETSQPGRRKHPRLQPAAAAVPPPRTGREHCRREAAVTSNLEPVDPAEPLVPWVGGKRLLAKRIAARIETVPHDCYAEPFVGMGGVFLRRPRRPRTEIVNDINGEIVNLFRIVREHPGELGAPAAGNARRAPGLSAPRRDAAGDADRRPARRAVLPDAGAELRRQAGQDARRLRHDRALVRAPVPARADPAFNRRRARPPAARPRRVPGLDGLHRALRPPVHVVLRGPAVLGPRARLRPRHLRPRRLRADGGDPAGDRGAGSC